MRTVARAAPTGARTFPEHGDRFFARLRGSMTRSERACPEDAAWPRPGELPDDREERERTGLFADVVVRHGYRLRA